MPRAEDDGRRPTILSNLVRRLADTLAPLPAAPPGIENEDEEPEATELERSTLIEIQTVLPPDFEASNHVCAGFLAQLSSCIEPVSYEILATEEKIVAQFALTETAEPTVRRQLSAHFPEAGLLPAKNALSNAWLEAAEETAIVEFGLENEFILPLATGLKL